MDAKTMPPPKGLASPYRIEALVDWGERLGAEIEKNFFADAEIISSYTRAQAIEDGELVDVARVAREAGITFPVAITRSVFNLYVAVPAGVPCQDEAGRLCDVLWMLRAAIRSGRGGDRIDFQLYVRNSKRSRLDRRDLVTLKAICGPGDDAAPVITIMLPEED
jgi:hypothetical protein